MQQGRVHTWGFFDGRSEFHNAAPRRPSFRRKLHPDPVSRSFPRVVGGCGDLFGHGLARGLLRSMDDHGPIWDRQLTLGLARALLLTRARHLEEVLVTLCVNDMLCSGVKLANSLAAPKRALKEQAPELMGGL